MSDSARWRAPATLNLETTVPMHLEGVPRSSMHREGSRWRMAKPKTAEYLEAALGRAEHAEAKYRSLVELVPAITYTEDFVSGRTFAISPQIEAVLRHTQEEWMGETRPCDVRTY